MIPISHRNTGALLHSVDAATLTNADLAGAALSGADLHFAVLNGADLRKADLRDAFLVDADLVDADLQGCDLRGAGLRGADLRRADLTAADLAQADLREANLAGARLGGARLDEARFAGVVLSDATYDQTTRWPPGLDPKRYGAKEVPGLPAGAETGSGSRPSTVRSMSLAAADRAWHGHPARVPQPHINRIGSSPARADTFCKGVLRRAAR
jgi:pentapeptide repeat protein